MTEPNSVGDALRDFVRENFLYMRPEFQFSDDESLLKRGVMDSLGVLEIVGFVEERWNVTVDEADITEANFGTIAAMSRYVAARLG
jgi:acyl carrier protein